MAKQAIDGRRLNAFAVDPTTVVVIGLDTQDGPDHPLYDERIKLPLDEGMVLNIMALGVKEPVIVRKVKTDGDDIVEVVDGRRRIVHAREANARLAAQGEPPVECPVMLAKGSDDLMESYAVSLNEIRVQDELLTKVAKCERMLARNGDNVQAAAINFGVTTTTIRMWQKIAELPADLKRAVATGRVAPTVAVKLQKLPADKRKEALESETVKPTGKGKRLSARNLKTAIDPRPLRERLADAADRRLGARLSPEEVEEVVTWMSTASAAKAAE